MKVTTDACILGACAPAPDHGKILDIGTGTGLLSLMLAQRTPAMIDAIENDEQSFLQAKENVANSPWSDRINVIHEDVKNFSREVKYDFIICNPPFFENQLHSPSFQKNQARHNLSLDSESLLDAVNKLIRSEGKFSVLLPYSQSSDFSRKAKTRELFLSGQFLIRNAPDRSFIRAIMTFEKSIPLKLKTEILSIKNESGQYSDFFQRLLKDFYLHL